MSEEKHTPELLKMVERLSDLASKASCIAIDNGQIDQIEGCRALIEEAGQLIDKATGKEELK